jgi:hypothetical protein
MEINHEIEQIAAELLNDFQKKHIVFAVSAAHTQNYERIRPHGIGSTGLLAL